jgi:putative cell wall-binding protein
VQFPDRAEEVYLAQAAESPDAVAAGVMTAGPILLVPRTGAVPASVRAEISRLRPDRVVALGGVAAVSDQMLRDAADGKATHRIAGGSRVDTAVAISSSEYSGDELAPSPHRRWADVAHLARADVFADAVAAGSLARGPILLVPSCGELPESVRSELRRLGVGQVVALGGQGAVCDDLLAQAGAALRR